MTLIIKPKQTAGNFHARHVKARKLKSYIDKDFLCRLCVACASDAAKNGKKKHPIGLDE